MKIEIHDDRNCELGEGPLWHPERKQLFWFDIQRQRLLTQRDGQAVDWRFDRQVSAAGWVDRDTLLVAGAGLLMGFDIATGRHWPVSPLDSERPGNRSNDGRADPWGGFWIGAMGRNAEQGAGSIWRYYRGEMRLLFGGVTIPNAICFSPDATFAHFADSAEGKVWRVPLGASGWPRGEPEIFLDLALEGLIPDGAVFDTEGHLWLAIWGGARIVRYDPCARPNMKFVLPVAQPTCPAFGSEALDVLYVTSARENLDETSLAEQPHAGCVFRIEAGVRGLQEHRVIL